MAPYVREQLDPVALEQAGERLRLVLRVAYREDSPDG
jgi:hypothetical protein